MAAAKRVMLAVLGLGSADAPGDGPKGGKRSLRRKKTSRPQPENPFLRSATQSAPVPTDMEVSKPEGRLGAAIGRWGLRLLVWLIIVAGVWGVFVRPFLNTDPEATAPPLVVNEDAAKSLAARFALDYVSYSPASLNADRSLALAAETAPGADVKAMSWSGGGYIVADAAVPGEVVQYPNLEAVVVVDVRASIAAPKKGSAAAKAPDVGPASSKPVTSAGVPAAAAGVLPAGYQIVRTVWLRLAVPVVQVSSGVRVAPAGPVFTQDPVPAARLAETTADPQPTSSTQDWVAGFMKAYAASAAQYQSSPGIDLAGLSSAMTLAEMGSWSLGLPGPTGMRAGSAAVTWKLAGADLTISQTYALAVTQDADRWYVSTLGPKGQAATS
jgi:hypothetical protein